MKAESKVFNMDCIEGMKQYPDNYFELAIVDPPYGINIMNSGGHPQKHGFKNWDKKEWDNDIPDINYFNELFRTSKNQIIWGGNYFTRFLNPSQGWIFWFKQKGMTFADGELAWTSFDKATRQYDLSGMGGNGRIHPTQKPVKLYKWLLTNYAKEGDKILDTHLGSGSSRIAAYDLGFEFTGFELDEDYFKASEKRFKQHTDQLTLF